MPDRPSPLFRWFEHTAAHINALSLRSTGAAALSDLASWAFDPNEQGQFFCARWLHRAPGTLTQAFVANLPASLGPEQRELAVSILKILAERGADLSVRTPHGQPLEKLAPPDLGSLVAELRGAGREEMEEKSRLRALASSLPSQEGAAGIVAAHQGDPHPIYLGVPAALGLALMHESWAGDPVLKKGSGKPLFGPVSIAQSRTRDLRCLARWALASLPPGQAQPAIAVMEAIARAYARFPVVSDTGYATHWDDCAQKLAAIAGRSALGPGNFALLDQALDGRFGVSTARIGQELARALLTWENAGQPDLWARALARSLDASTAWTVPRDSPTAWPPRNEAISRALLRSPVPPTPGTLLFQAMDAHVPAAFGLQVLLGAWVLAWKKYDATSANRGTKIPAANQDVATQAMGAAVQAWIRRHPELARAGAPIAWFDAVVPFHPAGQLPEPARSSLLAWQMEAALGSPTPAPGGPRL